MSIKHFFGCFLVLLLLTTSCQTINSLMVTNFSKSICSPDYPLGMKIQTINDSVSRVHLYIITRHLQSRISSDQLEYKDFQAIITVYPSFIKNKVLFQDSLIYRNSLSLSLKDTLLASLTLPIISIENHVVAVTLFDHNQQKSWIVTDIINKTSQKHQQNFVLQDSSGKILFRNYLIENEFFVINSTMKSLRFSHRSSLPSDFPEPPFSTYHFSKEAEKPIAMPSIYSNQISTFPFHGIIYSDSLNTMLPVFPASYPQLSEWDKLYLLRYICTENEFRLIEEEKNATIAWALFIADTKGSRETQKNKELRYYELATRANLLFTEDRFGWLTDRGMIYIVFGEPSKVVESDGYQSWWYDNEQNPYASIRFDFAKDNSQRYILQRSETFRNAWFEAVENWRVR